MGISIKRGLSTVTSEMTSPEVKRRRHSSSVESVLKSEFTSDPSEYGDRWVDWPAPHQAMEEARRFVMDVVQNKRSVLIVPDKDADGLSAGALLHRTFTHLGHPRDLITVHHLAKGTNVHADEERDRMAAVAAERVVVLDQGSRPGRALVPPLKDETSKRTLIIDHHMSDEWPESSQVLTACHTAPIATAALLTYMLLRDLHPSVRNEESWRAVVGVIGDLGPGEAKWGSPPWPSELRGVQKRSGSKVISDAVALINAPRRTAEYNVPKAWDIMLSARSPAEIASNAFLKLCRLDVRDETEKWARTAPKFSLDGRVAVVTIESGFQIHPVIATRWAGNLGRKSKKLIMVMCANIGFNPDPEKVSFSCRIAASLRSRPEGERPNLIALLNDYGDAIEGFRERVGGDYARGHKEATGGIIPKTEYALLLQQMGLPAADSPRKQQSTKAVPKERIIDPGQTNIRAFLKAIPPKADSKGEVE